MTNPSVAGAPRTSEPAPRPKPQSKPEQYIPTGTPSCAQCGRCVYDEQAGVYVCGAPKWARATGRGGEFMEAWARAQAQAMSRARGVYL